MKNVQLVLAATVLSLVSFGSFAESVTATGDTPDSAEAVIAQKAKDAGASGYTITSARMGNTTTMSAVLNK
ncbi:DUF1471 domain-containing protein [Morganella morganii]|uniref:DUF1471 domain-containing protein n=1 Tax=Morganella morganii TaxID=582 RepID=UPI0021D0D073|nr:DUF1471 domain-containing protein [Morganella morganii]MCU6211869.1 DUF1471 domain-containing protein [Morganella morganii]MCU6273331.1 DUF1471 domain-containing protein [Morganella morganii]